MNPTGLSGSPRMRSAFGLAALALLPLLLLFAAASAKAIPLFNRQTGQNCMACHAGGQFPELTPYGRMFKLTGYTIGQRTLPISAMAVASRSSVADTSKSDDPAADFQKNGDLIFATASLFLGGKVTENIGAFSQFTYDPYGKQADDGSFHGTTSADNIDIRWADRFVSPASDLIVGVSANNNPSVADPWNTAPAWMQYAPVPSPTSSAFIDGATPYPGYQAGGNLGGLSAYVFWNRSLYGEIGLYRSATGLFKFMSAGMPAGDITRLRGLNPYLRVAWNHEWGPHSLMLGAGTMSARIYDDPLAPDPAVVHRTTDWMLDAQYQYLLDPHALSAQLVYEHGRHRWPEGTAGQASSFVDASGNPLPATGGVDTTRLLRGHLSYTYDARYGGSVSFFDLSGNTNTLNQSSGVDPATLTITSDPSAGAPSTRVYGNLSGNPGTRGETFEVFWMPLQYLRVGLQYTAYQRFAGASKNYDGFGRNASDNNSTFLYLWAAY